MTMQVPLPRGISGSLATPKLEEYTLNQIFSQGALVSRPACELVTSVTGSPRGLFERGGKLCSVFGQTMYTGTTSLTSVGTVKGTGKIGTAKGFNHTAIATGNTNYIFDGTTLSATTDVHLPVARSVAYVDRRFVWVNADGEAIFYSEVGNADNVLATSFFDAETLPDENRLALNIRNDVFIFGVNSIERFRNVGTSSAPFVRVNNSIVSVGYVGGIVQTRDSFIFLGWDKEGGYQFYIHADGGAVPVSTDAINEILNTQYTKEQLETVSGQRFNWRGVDCYAFEMPDRTFIFSGGSPSNWGYLSSGTPIDLNYDRWGYQNAKLFNDTWFVQKSDGLYKLTTADSDTSGDFSRGFKTFMRVGDESVFTLSTLELSLAQNIETSTVGLSLSKDGHLWSDVMYQDTGGEYVNRLRFMAPGGLGRYEGYAGIIIRTTSNVPFSLTNMVAT